MPDLGPAADPALEPDAIPPGYWGEDEDDDPEDD
jgi:hypothetical protein